MRIKEINECSNGKCSIAINCNRCEEVNKIRFGRLTTALEQMAQILPMGNTIRERQCWEIVQEALMGSDISKTSSDGVSLIARERQRQIDAEGWTPEHDDKHTDGELALAAACYAEISVAIDREDQIINRDSYWPWDKDWWKPKTPLRDLVRAGALIAAEIDRRLRVGDDIQDGHGDK